MAAGRRARQPGSPLKEAGGRGALRALRPSGRKRRSSDQGGRLTREAGGGIVAAGVTSDYQPARRIRGVHAGRPAGAARRWRCSTRRCAGASRSCPCRWHRRGQDRAGAISRGSEAIGRAWRPREARNGTAIRPGVSQPAQTPGSVEGKMGPMGDGAASDRCAVVGCVSGWLEQERRLTGPRPWGVKPGGLRTGSTDPPRRTGASGPSGSSRPCGCRRWGC